MRLFIGNLPYNVTSDDLQRAFGEAGTVTSARVITDRETGQSRGFGFVEMGSAAEGQKAEPPPGWSERTTWATANARPDELGPAEGMWTEPVETTAVFERTTRFERNGRRT